MAAAAVGAPLFKVPLRPFDSFPGPSAPRRSSRERPPPISQGVITAPGLPDASPFILGFAASDRRIRPGPASSLVVSLEKRARGGNHVLLAVEKPSCFVVVAVGPSSSSALFSLS